jgi:hypothetical protein
VSDPHTGVRALLILLGVGFQCVAYLGTQLVSWPWYIRWPFFVGAALVGLVFLEMGILYNGLSS